MEDDPSERRGLKGRLSYEECYVESEELFLFSLFLFPVFG